MVCSMLSCPKSIIQVTNTSQPGHKKTIIVLLCVPGKSVTPVCDRVQRSFLVTSSGDQKSDVHLLNGKRGG